MRAPAVGIDGYRHGWVAARIERDTLSWAAAPVGAVRRLLDSGSFVGIDIPIGLADAGWRSVDAEARAALGAARSRVFMTPPRQVLALGLTAPNDTVQELSRRLTGQGTSRQALALAERIFDVDAVLTQEPHLRVIEVHPELSFAELAGGVLPSKKTATGVAQRLAALRGWRDDIDDALQQAPADVPIDDALDALAAVWSAARWRDGTARTLPEGATGRPCLTI